MHQLKRLLRNQEISVQILIAQNFSHSDSAWLFASEMRRNWCWLDSRPAFQSNRLSYKKDDPAQRSPTFLMKLIIESRKCGRISCWLGLFFIEFEFSLFYELEFEFNFCEFKFGFEFHFCESISNPVKIYQVFSSLENKRIFWAWRKSFVSKNKRLLSKIFSSSNPRCQPEYSRGRV